MLQHLPTLDQIQQERQRRKAADFQKQEEKTIAQSLEDCKSLSSFIAEAWHIVHPFEPFVGNWHIDLIARHLEAITRGEFLKIGRRNRLRINIPPGTMKSLEVNVFWTAWEWGPEGMPWIKNISTSYRDDFCLRDARRTRELVMSDWYQKRWRRKLKRTGESDFELEEGGAYKAMPFGSLTGGRAHRVKIDDPHSVDTAESDVERDRATLRFRESVTTRMIDQRESAIVVIMQRLHSNDISGVIDDLKLGYTNVILPMEFDPARKCITPFGEDPREIEGELLFPQRFPRETVEADKETMGEYAVAGQFQQTPTPREGGIFEEGWFKYVDEVPSNIVRRVRAYDLAASKHKTKKKGLKKAWTCGVKMSIDTKNRIYVEDVHRFQATPAGVTKAIIENAETDELNTVIDIPQDPGQAGKSQVSYLTTQLQAYTVFHSPESGSKEDRAGPFASQARVGNVYLVKGPWNAKFMDEIKLFPAAATKDQVDATSRAHARLVPKTRKGKKPHGAEVVKADDDPEP